jgi:hypothetical protein
VVAAGRLLISTFKEIDMETFLKIVGLVVLLFVIVAVVAAIMAVPMMLLVNYVFSPTALIAVFGGPIGYWKAFWLIFLCGLLFKSSFAQTRSED